MYYDVKLSASPEVSAKIVFENSRIIIASANPKLRAHINEVFSLPYYTGTPSKIESSTYSKFLKVFEPNTQEFFFVVPEILGWYGYSVERVDTLLKSIEFLDEEFLLKSSDSIYTNEEGDRIVRIVPKGKIAIKSDGTIIAGGRFLNANLDKEGAEWTLEDNPYESMGEDDREILRDNVYWGLHDYHPGLQNEIYTQDSSKAEEDYLTTGKTLAEVYTEAAGPEEDLPEMSRSPIFELEIPDNKILYSPELGIVAPGELWTSAPESYAQGTWYLFDKVDGDEDDFEFYVDTYGIKPNLFLEGYTSFFQAQKNLDVSGGVALILPSNDSVYSDTAKVDIFLNQPLKREFSLDELDTEKIELALEKVSQYRDLTQVRTATGLAMDEPALDALKVENLTGLASRFRGTLRGYQKAVVLAMTQKENYEVYGGPEGWHGYYLALSYGLGKSPIVLAAESVMRNNGSFKSGKQTTLITSPSKNTHVWRDEIEKFRNENATIIEGTRSERIAIWEGVLAQARTGDLPNLLIVSGSKFKVGTSEVEQEDTVDLEVDARYMQLLAIGGKSKGERVRGGHIAALVLDESGQYSNAASNRTKALSEVIETVYHGKGLVWSLNADLSGNSASDTISEASFINANVRQNYKDAVARYTSKDPKRPNSNARVWRPDGSIAEFVENFGGQIFKLDGKTIAQDKFGLRETPDLEAPLGKTWGDAYDVALAKMQAMYEQGKGMRALGLLQTLLGVSYGATGPERLIEYNLETEAIFAGAKKLLSEEKYATLREEVNSFIGKATEHKPGIGRLPKEGMPISKRNLLFASEVSTESKQILEAVLESWDNPTLDSMASQICDYLSEPSITNKKIGVAGFSRVAINLLAKKLKGRLDNSSTRILVFDGGTSSEQVGEQQKQHASEDLLSVVSLVTGAGLYGLSLPADRSWVFDTWNPAKLGQYGGRFHRNPYQDNLRTIVVPSGISQYVRDVRIGKSRIQEELKNELLDYDTGDENAVLSGSALKNLIDKLIAYRPRRLGRESGE